MEAFRNLVLVGTGGAAGSCLRYLISMGALRITGPGFPWGTLLVNLAGSIGLAWLLRAGASDHARLFFGIGMLGGFTTYSSFNFEVVQLMRQGHSSQAVAYVAVTFIVAFAAAIFVLSPFPHS